MIQVDAHSAEEIRASLARVLEREQIGLRVAPAYLQELLEWLGLPAVAAARAFVWAGPALLLIGLTILLVRYGRELRSGDRRREPAQAAAAAARARRVEELRERARAAEERGELALALRLEFFALVVALGEHGDLEFRAGWTNRELLARGAPAPALAARLSAELDALDPKTWGARAVDPADLVRVRALAGELLPGGAA